jgi:diguanylate cyclase (GGDEF)-like protein
MGVKTLELRFEDKGLHAISISLGVAVFPRHAKNRGTLLAAADACLYEAKTTGRDRVVGAR